MKFSEVVKTFSKFREAKTGDGHVSSADIRRLSAMYKRGEINESTLARGQAFLERKANSAGKAVRGNTGSTREDRAFATALEAKRSLNERRTGSRFVSDVDKKALREAVAARLNKAPANAGASRPHNTMSSFTEKDSNRAFYGVRSKIREARKALREEDVNAAAGAVQDASAQLGAIPADGANVPESVKTGVQNLKTQIDDLATQCGITPATDLGADPNAQIPAVTGADPTAAPAVNAAPQQTFESHKDVRTRIRERDAMLAKMKEGVGDVPGNMTQGEMAAGIVNTFGAGVSKANDNSQLTVASDAVLKNGSDKKSIKWPNKPVAAPKAPKNIAESKSLTEQDIDDFLSQKKFKFSDLYKLSNGLLG